MSKIYADAQGVILRALLSDADEATWGAPPGAAFTLDFDHATNANVIAGLDADWNSHDMVGGVLRRNGIAVPIAAPGQQYAARQQLQGAKSTIQGNAAGLNTYHGLSTPTNAQTVAAVKGLIEDVQAITTILRALIRDAN